MGMNVLGVPSRQGSLRYRENTLRSFQQAASCGASFVEFDVQVRFSVINRGLQRHRGLQAWYLGQWWYAHGAFMPAGLRQPPLC